MFCKSSPMLASGLPSRSRVPVAVRPVVRRAEEPKETSSGQDSYSVSLNANHIRAQCSLFRKCSYPAMAAVLVHCSGFVLKSTRAAAYRGTRSKRHSRPGPTSRSAQLGTGEAQPRHQGGILRPFQEVYGQRFQRIRHHAVSSARRLFDKSHYF